MKNFLWGLLTIILSPFLLLIFIFWVIPRVVIDMIVNGEEY